MASMSKRDGRHIVQVTVSGHRSTISLGRMGERAAVRYLDRISDLEQAARMGTQLEPETVAWVQSKVTATLAAKLEKAGLVKVTTKADELLLGDFLAQWMAARSAKPQTDVNYERTRQNLLDYYGEDRPVSSIGPRDAEAWRSWLVKGQRLAGATVSRRVKHARTIWRSGIRWGMFPDNPFESIKSGSQANESRTLFLSPQDVDRCIASAPDLEWRCVIALARYGGFRTPSETYALRWQDIDWDRGTIHVSVPKLDHIDGRGSRIIPLFSELRPYLLDLFHEAEPGAEYVIVKRRIDSGNLRTNMQRIIKRAGLVPWPRLFHNLRASRETELMREYDLKTVCAWIGNSPEVAARHYASSVDLSADFRRAAKTLQHGQAQASMDRQRIGEKSSFAQENADVPAGASSCNMPDDPSGVRTYPRKPSESRRVTASRCENAAIGLDDLIRLWPGLPREVRDEVAAVVRRWVGG